MKSLKYLIMDEADRILNLASQPRVLEIKMAPNIQHVRIVLTVYSLWLILVDFLAGL